MAHRNTEKSDAKLRISLEQSEQQVEREEPVCEHPKEGEDIVQVREESVQEECGRRATSVGRGRASGMIDRVKSGAADPAWGVRRTKWAPVEVRVVFASRTRRR